MIIPPVSGYKIGADVASVVGVLKYEKVDNNPSKPVRHKTLLWKFIHLYIYKWFPFFLRKERMPFPTKIVSITDETRIQNIPKVLNSHKGKEFVVSYKLDGSSITIIHEKTLFNSKFRICSRRFELFGNNDWVNTFNETNFKQHILNLVAHFKTNDIVVQGEMIGKFNGNHHNLSKPEIRLFNIVVNGERIDQKNFYYVCHILSIPCCPLFATTVLNHTLDQILEISNIPDCLNANVPAEGLVWRCIEDSLSFKVINNQYLLNEK